MFWALALRQSKSIHSDSDEGLTLETSAFNLATVANLPYQLTW